MIENLEHQYDEVVRYIDGFRAFPYDEFESKVFWVTMFLTAYFLVIMLPAWLKFNRARTTHHYVGYILEYTAIKSGD